MKSGKQGAPGVAERRTPSLVGQGMAVVWMVALVVFPAREATAGQATDLRVDTLDGRVYVSNPDLAVAGRPGDLTLGEELRIGAVHWRFLDRSGGVRRRDRLGRG